MMAMAAPLAGAQAPAASQKVLVVGAREGPQLWHFDGAQGEVYILGAVSWLRAAAAQALHLEHHPA